MMIRFEIVKGKTDVEALKLRFVIPSDCVIVNW